MSYLSMVAVSRTTVTERRYAAFLGDRYATVTRPLHDRYTAACRSMVAVSRMTARCRESV